MSTKYMTVGAVGRKVSMQMQWIIRIIKRRPRERNTFGFILCKLVQFTFHMFMRLDIK